MLERERLESKKISKTNAVTSQLDYDIGARNVHIGPSDYVPWLDDRKWAYIRLEGRSFGDVPLNIELKLEVVDSPNSAGIVIDAVRCAKLALDNGICGALEWPSAYFMKSPPVQHPDDGAATRSRRSSTRTRARPRRRQKAAGQELRRASADATVHLPGLPYALAGSHPVAEHVRDAATALAAARAPGDGARAQRLLAGAAQRTAAAALAGRRATPRPLHGAARASRWRWPSARPCRWRSAAAAGVGIPVAATANVALAVTRGRLRHRRRPRAAPAGDRDRGGEAHPRADRGHLPHRGRARPGRADARLPARALPRPHRRAARDRRAARPSAPPPSTRASTR